MLTDTRLHRGSNPKGLMNPHKIIVHVEQRDHRDMVVKFLTEGIRQSGKSTHVHSHVQILALYVAGRDMAKIGSTDQLDSFGPKTLRGAVTLLPFGIVAEDLDQLRVVDPFAEGVRHGSQVHLVPVRGQLDSSAQPARNVLKELRRMPRVSPAYKPAKNQLGFCIDGGKSPDIARIPNLLPHLQRGVFFLRIAEGPDLIDLDPLGRNVTDNPILVLRARLANTRQEAKDSALRYASQANGGAHGTPFDQCRNDRDLLFGADNVRHEPIIRYRFRIRKRKATKVQFLGCFSCFRPSRFGRFPGAPFALFVGHGFHPALAADLTSLAAHLTHDLLNDGKFCSRFYGFQEDPAGVLNGIELRGAFAVWHTPKRGTDRPDGSRGAFSNRPTTNLGKGARTLENRLVRPDADLEYLATHQEIAEVKRFLQAQVELNKLRADLVDYLKAVWLDHMPHAGLPEDSVFQQWIEIYGPDIARQAIIRSTSKRFLPTFRIVMYIFAICRRLSEEEAA